ncbi:MAG: PEP-utilizing enzyme mobile domain, partial [Actinomycetota bacterium]
AERGNALSHAAIIAREIGIPAVVASPYATSQLSTDDTITINGTTGSVTRESN